MTNALLRSADPSAPDPLSPNLKNPVPHQPSPPSALPADAPEHAPCPAPRRYLAIHLPKLPTDRIVRARLGNDWRQQERSRHPSATPAPVPPLVITAKHNNAIRLVHLDEQADHLGLVCGMSLTDARAVHPAIEVLEQEEDKDRLLLDAIADWCDRYTPLVAIDQTHPGQYGLTLDITGCAHLFGGERALMSDMLTRLFHQGFAAKAALAPTPGAAWALARFHLNSVNRNGYDIIRENTDIAPALAPLPIAGLRLSTDLVNMLARLGLRTIGQLAAQPRAPLARRFGRQLLLRLDQAMGAVEEAISPRRPVAELMAERRLAEPIGLQDDIEQITTRLAGHVAEKLEACGLGARLLQLCLFRVDGRVFHIEAGTSRPERDPSVITRLFNERFAALKEDFDAGYGFETMRLCVLSSQPLDQAETSFLQAGSSNNARHLVDRLAARLGDGNICRGLIEDTHLPEQAEKEIPAGRFENKKHETAVRISSQVHDHQTAIRPLRLFEIPECIEAVAGVPDGPPVRFRWRKVLHKVLRAEGPERISDHWWGKSNPRHTRDYFRVEDDRGHRYWLFREGLYERETGSPKWFLHGSFA